MYLPCTIMTMVPSMIVLYGPIFYGGTRDSRYAMIKAHSIMFLSLISSQLTHGSFTSILETLGQQALELQLERFWTVWSWSWDLEERIDFSEQFGEESL